MNLQEQILKVTQDLYGKEITALEFQATRKEFAGDITLVVFALLRHVKGNPVSIGSASRRTGEGSKCYCRVQRS